MKREDINIELLTALVKGYLDLNGFANKLYSINVDLSESPVYDALDGIDEAISIILNITDMRTDCITKSLGNGECVEDTVEFLLKLLD